MDRGENDNIVILRIRILQQFPNNFIEKKIKNLNDVPFQCQQMSINYWKKKLVCHFKNPKIVSKKTQKNKGIII